MEIAIKFYLIYSKEMQNIECNLISSQLLCFISWWHHWNNNKIDCDDVPSNRVIRNTLQLQLYFEQNKFKNFYFLNDWKTCKLEQLSELLVAIICHKDNRLKITDFHVRRKWFQTALKITYVFCKFFNNIIIIYYIIKKFTKFLDRFFGQIRSDLPCWTVT